MLRRQIIVALITLAFAAPSIAMAAGFVSIVPTKAQGSSCTGDGGCQSICDLAQLAQNILNDGIYLAVVMSAVLFVWAGFKSVTSGGDTSKYNSAKELFKNVVIGLVIILAAWLIVDTIIRTVAGASPGAPWNTICTGR